MKSEKLRVPKLRFKEFSGEWEEKKLGDVGKVSMCKRIMKDQTDIEGKIPFYKIGTFGKNADSYITGELYESYKSKYSFPKKGDILISASGTIGRTVVYNGEDAYFQDSNIVWIDNKEEMTKNSFLLFCYENIKWNTENTTIARLYNDNLRNIQVNIPTIQEQEKIASFLSSINKKIEQLSKKDELLETYKKGVMQKIFSQEIRFQADDGKKFCDWEEKKLGDFSSLIHGDGDWILSKDITYNGEYKIVQLGNIGLGKYIQKDLKAISLNTFEILKGTPIKKGDLLINRMVDGNINSCIFNIDGNYITSVDVCWIRENEYFNNYFMMNLLVFFKSQQVLLSLSSGSGRVRISKKNLFEKFDFLLPCLEEQTKIANFLSSIDTKISQNIKALEETKKFKKALLQKMFV